MAAVELSYEITGEGPPLYLVHGIGSRKVGWAGLLPHLEDRFTCVTSDPLYSPSADQERRNAPCSVSMTNCSVTCNSSP